MNKGQMEIVGLLIIVVIITIMFFFSIALFSGEEPETNTFQDEEYIDNLVPAILSSTSGCDNLSYREVFERHADPSQTTCENLGTEYDVYLNDSIRNLFEKLELGERYRYHFRMDIEGGSMAFNISESCTPENRTFMTEWPFTNSETDRRMKAILSICPNTEDL